MKTRLRNTSETPQNSLICSRVTYKRMRIPFQEFPQKHLRICSYGLFLERSTGGGYGGWRNGGWCHCTGASNRGGVLWWSPTAAGVALRVRAHQHEEDQVLATGPGGVHGHRDALTPAEEAPGGLPATREDGHRGGTQRRLELDLRVPPTLASLPEAEEGSVVGLNQGRCLHSMMLAAAADSCCASMLIAAAAAAAAALL